jgi:hypothetical protein
VREETGDVRRLSAAEALSASWLGFVAGVVTAVTTIVTVSHSDGGIGLVTGATLLLAAAGFALPTARPAWTWAGRGWAAGLLVVLLGHAWFWYAVSRISS